AGGDARAWGEIRPVWEAISAKVDPATGKEIRGAAPGKPVTGGEACAAWIGPGGAGHYVKMVHNGIEYGDMQLICEAYDLLRRVGGMTPEEMADVFEEWNAGALDSYLVEITSDILRQRDPETGAPFVDVVLDAAGQKGTGKWTSVAALDMGVPAPTIAEAVFARCVSAVKEERVAASKALAGPAAREAPVERERFVDMVRDAMLCAKICSYAQGFQIMRAAAAEQGWTPDFATIARIWRGGCIIRARFLQHIADAYTRDADLPNLLLDAHFAQTIDAGQANWREVVGIAARAGVPAPSFASALAYYDSYRCERLPASLLQAQRDYFGSHTYERTDRPRGEFFHLEWTTEGRPQSGA
ncbi:MAG: NADP-dependent phosphogluconate dehydrogenase, partial [Phycisphaerales bacterium]